MTSTPKPKPARHGRKPVPQNADAGVIQRRDAAITAFDRAFRARLPQHEGTKQNPISSGSYVQVEGDTFHDKTYPIADGRYRVQGSDWVLVFEGGGFVEALRAEAPHYGGKDVIGVTATEPANG